MTEPVPLADIYGAIRRACRDAGSQQAWAMSIGISPQYLNDILMGRKEPTDRVLAPLGLKRVTVFVRAK